MLNQVIGRTAILHQAGKMQRENRQLLNVASTERHCCLLSIPCLLLYESEKSMFPMLHKEFVYFKPFRFKILSLVLRSHPYKCIGSAFMVCRNFIDCKGYTSQWRHSQEQMKTWLEHRQLGNIANQLETFVNQVSLTCRCGRTIKTI